MPHSMYFIIKQLLKLKIEEHRLLRWGSEHGVSQANYDIQKMQFTGSTENESTKNKENEIFCLMELQLYDGNGSDSFLPSLSMEDPVG